MNLQKITINLGILLILDILLGSLYHQLTQLAKKPDMKANSERAFRRKEKYFHHGLIPDFDGQALWHRPYRMSTDNLGFKSDPGRKTSFCQDKRRMVFLGDSFTEGIGVEYRQTFAGLFAQANPYIDVVNMGVASYSPKLYKDKLRHFTGLGFQYDQLILCLDISDIQDEIVYYGMRARVDPRERRLFKLIDQLSKYSILVSVFQQLGRKTTLYNQVVGYQWKYSEERPKWPQDDHIFNEWGHMGLTLAASNVDTIIEMQRYHGKGMVMVVYPWPEQIRSGSYINRQTSFWERYCGVKQVTFVNLFDSFERESRRIGREKLLSEYFIPGDVHWNERGHAFVYRVLDSALRHHKVVL